MTRSLVKNISAHFRSAFWEKIFVPKRTKMGAVRTPKTYYRSKVRQQTQAAKNRK